MKKPEMETSSLFDETMVGIETDTKKSGYSPTPYDDVFRSMIAVCSRFLIPLVNEVFGKEYTGEEEITLYQNEIFVDEGNGKQRKLITDSKFAIISAKTEIFHIECQSSEDNTITVRMFDYGSQTALDHAVIEGNKMIVEFPQAAVLYLRSSDSTPDFLQVCIRAGGNSMEYEIPVIKLRKYEWETISQKKLFFLLPFQIFNDESKFEKCNRNEEALQKLADKYYQIALDLENLEQKGTITVAEKRHTLEMSYKVLDNVAAKYKNVVEGVGKFMSGTVLESEASLILKQGREEGIRQGIRLLIVTCREELLYDKTKTVQYIAKKYDLKESAAAQYVERYWGD